MTKKNAGVVITAPCDMTSNAHTRVEVFDTTLRDGVQGDGVKFSVHEMLQVALALDKFGVDFVEGGFPLSNPRDQEFFQRAQQLELVHSLLVAFGTPRRKGVTVDRDPGLLALLEAATPVVCLVAKASSSQVLDVLGMNHEEYIISVEESVRFLLAERKGLRVFVDAEHAFDGYRSDPNYVVELLQRVRDAGADRLVLCDTNGGSLPDHVGAVTAAVLNTVVDSRRNLAVGVHAHNDGDLAVANTLAAVTHGARHVQVTVNGIGERCGNADLVSVVANLSLKLGYDVLQPGSLKHLTELSRYVADRANLNPRVNQPFVGPAAFAHKGGLHVAALRKDPAHYEHIPPEAVGNARRVLISDLSGRQNLAQKLEQLGLKCEDKGETLLKILQQVELREKEGWQFDFADASFHLLALELLNRRKHRFELQGYDVQVRADGSGLPAGEQAVAWVKIKVGGKMRKAIAEGCGPVHALDLALREVLEPTYPDLATVKLSEYTVRVIPGTGDHRNSGNTDSAVRVFIRMQDEEGNAWGTVGVAHNIVAASYRALVDALEYKFILDARKVLDPV